ncbi:MAG: isoprenoid biosynthesis protein ElbB [Bacteroidetes bacterium]|nr:MAG: isoprenoid biosynthesis protein ElbB [Bacteroidota bacterium]
MKIGVLLSGCGVYDGSEIQEAVLSMLAIEQAGHQYQCISLNEDQYHVVNHTNGEEMPETRNMLIEAARIARGNIQEVGDVQLNELSALLIPGGFGSAKNFSNWAFEGPDGSIHPKIKKLIQDFHEHQKPIIALCVSPVLLAKAFEGTGIHCSLTLGTSEEASPYDIREMHAGMEKLDVQTELKSSREILVDRKNKLICAPCYMMDVNISQIYENVRQALSGLSDL